MFYLDHLKLRNRRSIPVVNDQRMRQLNAFDMGAALDAHHTWLHQFKSEMLCPLANRDTVELATDARCALGQWLYDAARSELGEDPEFIALRQTHADFRKVAGGIRLHFQAQPSTITEQILEEELRPVSDRLQLAIVSYFTRRQH